MEWCTLSHWIVFIAGLMIGGILGILFIAFVMGSAELNREIDNRKPGQTKKRD